MARKIKYSKDFERDYEWYLKWCNVFNFDANSDYTDKKGNQLIIADENGNTAKECFYIYDSTGKIVSCNDPELYLKILKCKGSINFQIKQWAECWGKAEMSGPEFIEIIKEFELLEWMKVAVQKQRTKYWDLDRDLQIMKDHNERIRIKRKKEKPKMINIIFQLLKTLASSIIIKKVMKDK
jgi:hypothetical protein